MKRTAVANQKGGVGKTTLEAHLACYAAEQGKRVLVLDLDESDLSQFLPPHRGWRRYALPHGQSAFH